MNQLKGKVALVTGASRGIGKAIAIALAEAGADVVVAARDAKALESLSQKISGLGVKVAAVPTDVTQEPQIVNLFNKTMEKFGRVDVLVNNAGVFGGSPLESM